MRNFNKIFVWVVVFLLNLLIYEIGFSQQERRNPFKNWFPEIKKKIQEVDTKQIVSFKVEEERIFDVSLYSLQGVVWGEYTPKAIINNRIYSLGDKLGEAEIIIIDKRGVAVNFNEKEYLIGSKNVSIKEEKEEKEEQEEEEEQGVSNDEF